MFTSTTTETPILPSTKRIKAMAKLFKSYSPQGGKWAVTESSRSAITSFGRSAQTEGE
jgi:hypothetical protein